MIEKPIDPIRSWAPPDFRLRADGVRDSFFLDRRPVRVSSLEDRRHQRDWNRLPRRWCKSTESLARHRPSINAKSNYVRARRKPVLHLSSVASPRTCLQF